MENNLSKTGGNKLSFRALGLFAALTASIYTNLILIQNIWFHLILGVFAGLCVGVLAAYAHESVHQVFATKKWQNRLMTHFIDLMGACSLAYTISHSKHHNFTNVEGSDNDIHFEPFIRLNHTQKWYWWHIFQPIYTPILYAFSSLFLVLDIRGFAIFKNRKLSQKIVFWLSKMLHILVFVIVQIICLGFWVGLMVYFSIILTSGLYLGFVVEPSHLFKATSFTEPNPKTTKIEITWDQVMLNSSANFSPKNAIINWLTGGLNFHLVHSLYPKISHIHYPKINSIIHACAIEKNLEYRQFSSYWAILKSHFSHLREMSQPN